MNEGYSINPLNVDVCHRRMEGEREILYSVKLNRELERRGARIPWNSARFISPFNTDVRFRRELLLARVPHPQASVTLSFVSRVNPVSLNRAR